MKRTTHILFATFALGTFLNAGALAAAPAVADFSPTKAVEGALIQAETEMVDLNSASLKELRSLPGIGIVYSMRIAENRPYKAVEDLRARNIVPKHTYAKIQGKVVANGQ